MTRSWPGAGSSIPAGREASLEPEPRSFGNGHAEDGANTSARYGEGRGTPSSWKETLRRQMEMGE